jgi:general secretion pathway protein D
MDAQCHPEGGIFNKPTDSDAMKVSGNAKYVIVFWCACLLTLCFLGHAASAAAQKPELASPAPAEQKRSVTIDFNDVDIRVFIRFISQLMGKNFVIDRRVKGEVTVMSPTPLTVRQAYQVFESVLEVHGYAAVESGKIIKILPLSEARTQNIETQGGRHSKPPTDRLVTRLIPLQYADPAEVRSLIAPMVSKNSLVQAYPETQTLIITDIDSNLRRLLGIIKKLDEPDFSHKLMVIPLKYMDSDKMAQILMPILQKRLGVKSVGPAGEIKVASDPRTNAIVLLARSADVIYLKQLIRELDQKPAEEDANIHVYSLENALAEDLAKELQDLPAKTRTGEAPQGKAPLLSDNIRISVHKATNSLIIAASSSDYERIKEVIQQLDIPRSMVYIEALIMEVDAKREFNIGVDWTGAFKTDVFGKSAVAGARFAPNAGGASAEALADPVGFSMGIISEAIEITTGEGTIRLPNLGAVAQIFKNDNDFRVLSTPQLLATDNEEASIVIADNIPFVTRTTVVSFDNEYDTIEYRDVGFTLKLLPQITTDGSVKLDLSLEATNLTTSADRSELLPTTLKRRFETTAIVSDSNTIVIGGALTTQASDNHNYVPVLGDMPGTRWFFRSSKQSDQQIKLYVFIRPRVL